MPTRSRASTSRLAEFVQMRDREHAAQLLEAGGIPLQKRVQNGFRIAVGMEAMARLLQLGAQFQVVIDFAVEDDGGVAVVGVKRLVAGFQIEDLEAGGSQRAGSGFVDTLLVWSAMDQCRRSFGNPLWARQSALMCETNYPAHDFLAWSLRKPGERLTLC